MGKGVPESSLKELVQGDRAQGPNFHLDERLAKSCLEAKGHATFIGGPHGQEEPDTAGPQASGGEGEKAGGGIVQMAGVVDREDDW